MNTETLQLRNLTQQEEEKYSLYKQAKGKAATLADFIQRIDKINKRNTAQPLINIGGMIMPTPTAEEKSALLNEIHKVNN